MGGSFNAVNLTYVGPLVRFHADGSLDDSFDSGGIDNWKDAEHTELEAVGLHPSDDVLEAYDVDSNDE